jgi:hypothetical protein
VVGRKSLAFWAGDVGLIIIAEDMTIHNIYGEIKIQEIGTLVSEWWDYWKEYWNVKDTQKALPKDYACEVTNL